MNDSRKTFFLNFNNKEFENKYVESSIDSNVRFFRSITAIAIAINALYVIKDVFWTPSNLIPIRLWVEIPIYLIALLATYSNYIKKSLYTFNSIVIPIVLFAIFAHLKIIIDNPNSSNQFSHGIPIIMFGIYLFAGLQFRYLLIVGVIFTVSTFFTLYYFTNYDTSIYVDLSIVYVIVFTMASFAAFFFCRSRRIQFYEKEKIKALNNELRSQKALYEAIMDNSKDLISIVDPNLVTTYRSKAAIEFMGEPRPNEQTMLDRLHPDDIEMVKNEFLPNALKGKTINGKVRITSIKGDLMWLNIIAAPMKNTNNEVKNMLVISRDITESKANDDKLAIANSELIKLNEEKIKFFGVIAHDLSGAMGTLSSISKYLNQEFNSLDPKELHKFVKGLDTTAQNGFTMLRDLLEWSQSQMLNQLAEKTSFLLAELVESVANNMATSSPKSVIVNNHIKNDLKIVADKTMIRTVVRNLISNSYKFTGNEAVINISAEIEKDDVVIHIEDNGVGIDQKRIATIFDFGEAKSTRGTNNEKGTGLGLSICKELIEKNQGLISVESAVNQGTKFTIKIPLN